MNQLVKDNLKVMFSEYKYIYVEILRPRMDILVTRNNLFIHICE
jgi:hypothetical protein